VSGPAVIGIDPGKHARSRSSVAVLGALRVIRPDIGESFASLTADARAIHHDMIKIEKVRDGDIGLKCPCGDDW